MSLTDRSEHRMRMLRSVRRLMLPCVCIALALIPVTGAAASPGAPSRVSVSPGATGTVAALSWSGSADRTGVAGYSVWRSDSPSGEFVVIGTTTSNGFSDRSGVSGRTYYYRVGVLTGGGAAAPMSPSFGPVRASWTRAAHASYSSGNVCQSCHALHQATTPGSILQQGGGRQAEVDMCLACHDGQGAKTNVKNGSQDSFALSSGHTLDATGSAGLTGGCSSCHSPHAVAAERPGLWKARIGGRKVSGGNAWCTACHDDAGSWGPGRANMSAPARDASGYPVSGTFPGPRVYGDKRKNAHADLPPSRPGGPKGDCLTCHAAHRGRNAYDGLLLMYRPTSAGTLLPDQTEGTYAELCLTCHGGGAASVASGAVDIKRFVADGIDEKSTAGHRIRTRGGTLPVGAPLPCYDCHDPHGSSRGNASMISDELGRGLATGKPGQVRAFCLTCHTTADGLVWDSALRRLIAVGTGTVEGLRRNGSGGNVLRLKKLTGAGHMSNDTTSCYSCHGADYSAPGSHNVHDPSTGASPGGKACYACHETYAAPMERTGADAVDFAHHVLGSTEVSGDAAPKPGAYPTVGGTGYCVSCHVDHDAFNADRGANLRASATDPSGKPANTDFSAEAPYGLCVSCHSVTLQRGGSQLPGATDRTRSIVGSEFAGSAHDYLVSSSFGASEFRADCSKCHSDEQDKPLQTSAARFGTHASIETRLLGALGVNDISKGRADAGYCFRCHSTEGNPNAVIGRDWYGVVEMTPGALGIKALFGSGNGHPVGEASGAHSDNEMNGSTPTWPWTARHVECADCHDVHQARRGLHAEGSSIAGGAVRGAVGVKPLGGATNWGIPEKYDSVVLKGAAGDLEAYLCFKCHSSFGGTPSGDTPGGGARTDIAQEFNAANASLHNVLGLETGVKTTFVVDGSTYAWDFPSTGVFKPGWGPDSKLTCTSCHSGGAGGAAGPHGSSAPFMIDPAYPIPWKDAALRKTAPGMDPGVLCSKCHELTDGSTWGNNVHKTHGAKCTSCHIGVPHGWKRPRLLGYTNDPAPYAVQPGGTTRLSVGDHTPTGWKASDCGAACHTQDHPLDGTRWP